MNPPAPLPVIVLTGFLGSGKTTLLNRLLAEGPRTAVIINEFGGTPVDQQLIERQGMPMTVLAGGCLCCQIKGALAPTLRNLWMAWQRAEPKPFERMIIEASGIASPEPILDTLLRDRWLASRYRLERIITTLAIPSAINQLDSFAEARAQVVWADTLLLTHDDLADADQKHELAEHLRVIAPATPQTTALLGQYDAAPLLSGTSPALRRLPNGDPTPQHGFQSLSLHLEHPQSWPRLQTALQGLLDRHPLDLLRIKGVVYLSDRNEPVVIQAADKRLYPPASLPARAFDDQRSRLVFITRDSAEALAEDLHDAFGSSISKNAIRLH
ncbi:MAG: GTP-binding protein [Methylococcaceae bacterium]|nr:GTP-binding protein [Methylococcaceae bacterium]